MNNDRFTHLLAPLLILCAIASILFVSVHAATLGFDDLRFAAHGTPEATAVYVKAPPAAHPTRVTVLPGAQHG